MTLHRITTTLGLVLAMALATLCLSSPADAAGNRTPGCITRAEFDRIQVGTMGFPRVRQIVGKISGRIDKYETSTVYFDDYGNNISQSEYYSIPGGYSRTGTDEVRSYPKCRSWRGGDRRISVWVDDYTHGPDPVAYGKYPYQVVSAG